MPTGPRAGRSGGSACLVIDVTRTVARSRYPAPTGIDRVERAYIDWGLARGARFLARIGARQYLFDATAMGSVRATWDRAGRAGRLTGWYRQQRANLAVRRAGTVFHPGRTEMPPATVYLNVGHTNLDPEGVRALRASGAAVAVMLHDLIPLEHPEFCRAGTEARFRRVLAAAGAADRILCNSADTAARVARHMPDRTAPVTLPLGIEPAPPVGPRAPGPARFVCLGTIEPRKNHRLLLDLWADWPQAGEAPHLVLVGRRGWENRDVFAILDRAPMMGRTVFEAGSLDDGALEQGLAGATALLMPSRAEGFGLPLAEALARGLPVIASDLPALREVGGAIPEWLDPDDRAGWARAIADFAATPAPRRDAQIARMAGWQPPTWAAHFAALENDLETILQQNGTGS